MPLHLVSEDRETILSCARFAAQQYRCLHNPEIIRGIPKWILALPRHPEVFCEKYAEEMKFDLRIGEVAGPLFCKTFFTYLRAMAFLGVRTIGELEDNLWLAGELNKLEDFDG